MFIYHFRFLMLAYLIIANASVAVLMQETVKLQLKFEDGIEVKNYELDIDIIKIIKTIDNLIQDVGGDYGKIIIPISLSTRSLVFESVIKILSAANKMLFVSKIEKSKTIHITHKINQEDFPELQNKVEEILMWERMSSDDLLGFIEAAKYLDVPVIVHAGAKLWVRQYSATKGGFNSLNGDIKAEIIKHIKPFQFLNLMRVNENEQIVEQEGSFRVALIVHYGTKEPPTGITAKMHYEELYRIDGFVCIPGGTYEIGSPTTEANRYMNEKLHTITLSPFLIMDAAVTQELYAKMTGTNPSKFKEEKYCPKSFVKIRVNGVKVPVCLGYPVEMVSHDDATKFAQLMSMQDQKHSYSLATEAQLEVAFRGETTTAYVSGNDEEGLGEYVWHLTNSNNQTHPVKSKRANAFGIFRSSVWEWGADFYDRDYSGSMGLDPKGPNSGLFRVVRGGSWNHEGLYYRSAYRYPCRPDNRFDGLGFRLVRT